MILEDVLQSSPFLAAPLITAYDVSRDFLNVKAVEAFARHSRQPLKWFFAEHFYREGFRVIEDEKLKELYPL